MLNKILVGLFILGLFTKCKDGLLNESNELNIKALIADTVTKDTQIYIPIVLTNSKYKMREGVLNCNITDTMAVDTTKFILIPGYTHLIISYDTAKFWLNTGTKSGQFTNDDITILAKGQDNKFYYQKVSFDYFVK